VHARRALLLLAIVLGAAALAAAVSQAPRGDRAPEAVPTAPDIRAPTQLRLSAARRPRTLALRAGAAATLTVRVPEAGTVRVSALGLLSPADERTPAVLPLRVERPGRYAVVFIPSGSEDQRRVGAVDVRAERRRR
jgi:hypothetical protein